MTTPKTPRKRAPKETNLTDQTAIDTTGAIETTIAEEIAVAPPKGPRTLDEKIAATEALLAKYIAERDNVSAVADIQVGDDVTFKYGRPLGSKMLTGTVAALGTDKVFGAMAAVIIGAGTLEVETVKTRVANITENRSADERATQLAAQDGSEASEDPLASE